jgi:hypothetical protein
MPAPTNPNNQQTPSTPGTAPGNADPNNLPAGDPPSGDLPAGDLPDTSTQNAGADEGAGQRGRRSSKPDGITPEIEAYLNSELRKARIAAEGDGERRGRETLQAELEDQNATDTERLTKATNKVTQLQQELADANNNHARLLMALKVGLPKPEVNFKRLIITSDEAALEADALELKESLGVQPNGNQQPVHTPRGPSGGSSTQRPPRSEDEETQVQRVGAQASDPMYKSL